MSIKERIIEFFGYRDFKYYDKDGIDVTHIPNVFLNHNEIVTKNFWVVTPMSILNGLTWVAIYSGLILSVLFFAYTQYISISYGYQPELTFLEEIVAVVGLVVCVSVFSIVCILAVFIGIDLMTETELYRKKE
jgi:hypothetical protein